MLEIEKLVSPAVDWTGQTLAQRVDDAASFLFVHGYIPLAVRIKITSKLEKQFRKGIDDGRIVERAE